VDTVKAGKLKIRGRKWTWLWISLLVLVIGVVIVGDVVLFHAGPILKGRVEETLRARFRSRVDLGTFNVFILRGIEVSGGELHIYPPEDLAAAGATKPLLSIEHFQFRTGILGLFLKPTHVRQVEVSGLAINIPPRSQGARRPSEKTHKSEIKVVVDEIICDNSRLIIGASNPNKDPKDFELKHIVLHDLGPSNPWKYEAVLTNALPRGEIHSVGTFGPWQIESPGDSSVEGHYTFEHADLSTIKGLGGVLSSVGIFKGQLNRILVDGTTETPDFSLEIANHPVPLRTQFRAIVDGTTGDTYLPMVNARLRNSSFTTSGAVVNIKGQGHKVDLDVNVPSAELQDFLDLALRTQPPIMTGFISTRAKLHIGAGRENIAQKLALDGRFSIKDIHFTNPQVQDKVDMLSLRAQGKPKKAKPGAKEVSSQLTGTFQMQNGAMRFSELAYVLPGARVNLEGIYSMDGQQFDFHGKVLTDASLSQMVGSPVASLLLKAISPFFKNKTTGGAEIPVSIQGTKSAPKFGLDVFRHR
jgi:hypothetical protein